MVRPIQTVPVPTKSPSSHAILDGGQYRRRSYSAHDLHRGESLSPFSAVLTVDP